MDARLHRRADRYDFGGIVLLIVLIPAVFGPLLNHLVRGTATSVPYTDHPAHNVFAAEMRQERRVTMPHPLYHFVLIGVQGILHPAEAATEPDARAAIAAAGKEMQGGRLAELNFRYASASVVTLSIFLVLLGIVLWFPVRGALSKQPPPRPSPGVPEEGARGEMLRMAMAISLILGLMLVAPIALLHGVDQDFYFGYIGINVWHGPTVIAAKPFALVAFFLVAAALSGTNQPLTGERVRWIFSGICVAAVVVVGALGKPSFLMCLLPAAMLVAVYRAFVAKQPVRWVPLLAAILLPAIVTLAWQSRMYAALTGGAHAKFAPFATMLSMSPEHLAVKFGLSILFPAVCYLVWWPETRRRFRLNFAWLTFFIGISFTYLLAESRRTAHGNFLWSAQLALFVLFVESTLCLLECARGRWAQPNHRLRTTALVGMCAGIFGMHLWFGIAYCAKMFLTPHTVPLLYR
jgi:hypothetical protein